LSPDRTGFECTISECTGSGSRDRIADGSTQAVLIIFAVFFFISLCVNLMKME